MNEENINRLLSELPKGNPFATPDGYFDTLADRIIGQLPAEAAVADIAEARQPKPAARLRRLRPWLYAAAFAGVVAMSATLFMHQREADPTGADALAASYNDTYFDDAADYAMLDNEDIYYSLLADM